MENKIEDLEDDWKELMKHFVILEKEKAESDRKYKNLEFKIQGYKNEIGQLKLDYDEIEEENTKLEKNCIELSKELTLLKQHIKNHEFLQSQYIDQNPNNSISRISLNM